jgi:hypothetical protein
LLRAGSSLRLKNGFAQDDAGLIFERLKPHNSPSFDTLRLSFDNPQYGAFFCFPAIV